MKLYTAEMSRAMDMSAINGYSISGITLMERASRRLFDTSVSHASGGAAVFCGGGNNGGDGFGSAWLLAEIGIPVRVFFIGNREKMTAEAAEMCRRFESAGGKIEPFDPENADIISYTRKSSVIIDALLGIGFSSAPRGLFKDAIELINSSDAFVIAADIPSGVEADTGLIYGDYDALMFHLIQLLVDCIDKGFVMTYITILPRHQRQIFSLQICNMVLFKQETGLITETNHTVIFPLRQIKDSFLQVCDYMDISTTFRQCIDNRTRTHKGDISFLYVS